MDRSTAMQLSFYVYIRFEPISSFSRAACPSVCLSPGMWQKSRAVAVGHCGKSLPGEEGMIPRSRCSPSACLPTEAAHLAAVRPPVTHKMHTHATGSPHFLCTLFRDKRGHFFDYVPQVMYTLSARSLFVGTTNEASLNSKKMRDKTTRSLFYKGHLTYKGHF